MALAVNIGSVSRAARVYCQSPSRCRRTSLLDTSPYSSLTLRHTQRVVREGNAMSPAQFSRAFHVSQSQHERRQERGPGNSRGLSPLDEMKERERVHAAVLQLIPLQGIAVPDLARKLPDTLMESAFPNGLMQYLREHPNFYLISQSGPSGIAMVKRFLHQRSGVLVSSQGGGQSNVKPRIAVAQSVTSTDQMVVDSIHPLINLWDVFLMQQTKSTKDASSNEMPSSDVVQRFLKILLECSGTVKLFCLVEELSDAVHDVCDTSALRDDSQRAPVLEAFQCWEERLASLRELTSSQIACAFQQHVSRPRVEGRAWWNPCMQSSPLLGSKRCCTATGAPLYRHNFFIRSSTKSALKLISAIVKHAGAPTSGGTSPVSGKSLTYAAEDAARRVDWDAVLDYEAFRISPYLSTRAATPLRGFHLAQSPDPSALVLSEVVQSLSRPLAMTLAVFAILQEHGDMPYMRYQRVKECPPPALPSIFRWYLSDGAAAWSTGALSRVGNEGSLYSIGWVTGVGFALDKRACLPADCFREWEDIQKELQEVQTELKEVKRLRRCGAFPRRLLLTNRRRHLQICSNILGDTEMYSLYHSDVLAYYLYDRLPNVAQGHPGTEWKAVFRYDNLASLLPSPLDRRALVSSELLRKYPHLFVLFILQGQRVVVRRDVFDSLSETFYQSQSESAATTPLRTPLQDWGLSDLLGNSALTTAMDAATVAAVLFDPALRLRSEDELVQYISYLIARRRGRRRKHAGSVLISLESLREMLPRSFSNLFRRLNGTPRSLLAEAVRQPKYITRTKESVEDKPKPITEKGKEAPRESSACDAEGSGGMPTTIDPDFLDFLKRHSDVFVVTENTFVDLTESMGVKAIKDSDVGDTLSC